MVEKIREIAKKRGITLAKIERDLNFAQGYIRKWDIQKPAYDRLLAVAKYLNVPISYIAEENDMTKEEAKIISDYRQSDERGKTTIISIAEIEARRSRKEAGETDPGEGLKPYA